MTRVREINGTTAAGVVSLAVGVESLLNAALIDSFIAPSARLVVAATYTGAGGVLLVMGRSSSRQRIRRGREETRGRADS